MSRYKALVTAEVVTEMLECLKDRIDFTYDGYYLNHNVMPHNELVRKIKNYDILVSEYDTVSKDVLENAQNLKIIICCRGGIKNVVDIGEAKSRNIMVCNNAGRNANAVSDMTIAYILNMTRNICKVNNLIHNREITMGESSKPAEYKDTVWGLDDNSPFIKYRGRSINHMTLGLIGFGHAGRLVAKKANAFSMKIIAYDPYIDLDNKPEYVEVVTIDELFSLSDIISLHCTLTEQTKKMFNQERFMQMKSGSYFINTARGDLVDEQALISALNSGHIAGAAIDVTEKEPISSSSSLLGVQNLIITPHIAGSSYDVQVTGTQMVLDALNCWLEGKIPNNCVVY